MLSVKFELEYRPKALQKRVERKNRIVLFRSAGFARTAMKSQIRKSKKVSKPGKPPKSHSGELRRLMRFSVDTKIKTWIVGPEIFTGGRFKTNRPIPEVLNDGGNIIWRGKVKGKRVKSKVNIRARPFKQKPMDKGREKMFELLENLPL